MDSLFYFLNNGFWKRVDLLAAFAVTIFVIVLIRYLITALSYQLLLQKVFGVRSAIKTRRHQISQEVRWSIVSSGIFAVLSVGTYILYQNGLTKVYADIAERSGGYFVFSIVLLLVMYETYYYWLHRWMHHPSVFKIVHKVHHQSLHPTVFTSFSFHPLEAILQFIFLPVVVMIMPIHYYALGTVLLIMTVSAVINHAGVEIFPKSFLRHPIAKWFIGSTHHDLHHKEFRTNFGLYLTFWDRMMKTENEKFEKQFELNKDLLSQSRSQHRPSTGDQHM